MPFRDFLELLNQPYWVWDTYFHQDTSTPIVKTENGNSVYYFLLPGFNRDNLEVTQAGNVVSITGKREGKGVGDDAINLSFNIKAGCNIVASINDGILKIEVVGSEKEDVRKIELK